MTALRDAIDTTTLGWIKPEIDETLRQARGEIEAFAENPADTTLMRACASFLHQVHGTLRMVELYAPAMVAEEMERLAHALVVPQGAKGAVADRDEACGALMRGVVLLPDYLERLQGGHKDIPIVLLPLLNELRAARGETGLSESVLFAPDLQRPVPGAQTADVHASRAPRESAAAPMLSQLRAALAAWPEQGAPADVHALSMAIDGLLALTGEETERRMLWVASLAADALGGGALASTAGLRQAFASVERETRRLFESDRAGLPARADAALEPTRQLLYHVAQSDGEHPALRNLRETFDLGAQSPSDSELEHARGSLTGRNRALLDTVSVAIKEDLLRVKDVLDLHLRNDQADIAGLQPQVDALGRVADTLGMLGLGVARNVVQQQRDAMQALVSGDRAADEGALLDIAGALLYVDASLDEQVAHLGGPDTNADESMLAGESRKVLEIVVREAIANFADARQAFVAFVETSWDHAELAEVPRLLQEVSGALRMLDLQLPADYLAGVRLYAERELIGRHRVPNGRQLDTLADALASLEYYLEALREQRANRDDILDIARNSLESLQYWPLPQIEAATADVSADVGAADCHRTIAAGTGSSDRRTGRHGHRRLRSHRRRNRRRNPRSLPRGIRRGNRQPRPIAAAVARSPGRRGKTASDPARVPHLEGQRPSGRRQDAGRVQLAHRGHAQPRARRLAPGERRRGRDGRSGFLRIAPIACRPAWRKRYLRRPGRHAGRCRPHRCGRRRVLHRGCRAATRRRCRAG